MRHERDYIERTIATVRNHRDADNCWPQWANIFADEIEDGWARVRELEAALRAARRERDEVYAVNAAAANDRANAYEDALREVETLCERGRIPLPLLNSRILRVIDAALAVSPEERGETT